MIQLRKLDEAAYAGEKYKEWPCSVKGNNDCLSITQPNSDDKPLQWSATNQLSEEDLRKMSKHIIRTYGGKM